MKRILRKQPLRKYYFLPILMGQLLLLSLVGVGQNIDFGKSYINVSKGTTGGTVEPGDTLEMRASFVVLSGTYDSCSYVDAVPAGTTYVPGTIRVLTNEGKIYKQFTDIPGDDPGWKFGSLIYINLGYSTSNPATATRRGRVANTHKPSFWGGTCIMVASFRVVVKVPYGSIISNSGGYMTYKRQTAPADASVKIFTFPSNTIAIYPNYGMCPNAVGVNALGTEFNGTFGSGPTRNRGTSANVPPGYTYSLFTNNGPNDYYYGIANNTSNISNYTTTNAWPIPDGSSPTHRVFTVWDIIGDHTNAADPFAGNPPADTVANNNAGYMLVVNAAYRIDSAFQQTISNLCPNTYYEISCWMRNICSRCGCDSNGRGAGNFGYIPTAPGDSSGVMPNLTFEVNGVDYYTSGNVQYTGQWTKRGFTYLTKPAETSINLKLINNAPGGGGNDWALDDISVSACMPDLTLNPSPNPNVCANNTIDMGAVVTSYFPNYVEYKWQISTDNGSTWSDDPSGPGTGSPIWNGSNWEYTVDYPTFVASLADSGKLYSLVIASTPANLANNGCRFADSSGIITLNVLDCGVPLDTRFLSFNGHWEGDQVQLSWTTSMETEDFRFDVERSHDGIRYHPIGSVNGQGNHTSEMNTRGYTDHEATGKQYYYRIRMVSTVTGNYTYSRVLQLTGTISPFALESAVNPFGNQLELKLASPRNDMADFVLINNSGVVVRKEKRLLNKGSNVITLNNTQALPPGVYFLSISLKDEQPIRRKLVKQ